MGIFNRKSSLGAKVDALTDLVKGLPGGTLGIGAAGAALNSGATGPLIASMQPGAPLAASLARQPQDFAGALGPGYPFLPVPLDELGPDGRPKPRKYLYDVATNLNINAKLAQWNVLATAAVQVDIFARAITVRQGDVTKMDWSWNPSKDAINQIMEDNHVGNAEAAKIARTTLMPLINKLTEFWQNPYPQSDRSWEEWITEAMWQVLVYDGWCTHPSFTLGGEVLGLDIIDASTIKILLDNYGDIPRPPDPAFQQILYGFPRGEFIASADKNITNYLGGEFNVSDRDQLSYFVMNRRTNSPYGFSPVEQALQMANIYLERQKWMLAEYQFGTQAGVYMRTNSQEITLNNIESASRILNDRLMGNTANRMGTIYLPDGFDPTFAPQIQEKYRSDYDEDLIKRTCSFFGVDARQFGIVPRAGLGGGKGAAEGAADNDETVSSKPQNKYIERCVMSLSLRYLGATRMVSFDLKDDEGTEDELQLANASNVWVSAGLRTRNEVRSEQGLPLSSEPEADALAVTTPQGPVFLTGMLEGQLNPPPPPPNPFGGPDANASRATSGDSPAQPQEGPPQEGGQGKGQEGESQAGQSAGKETPPGLKDKEKAAYRSFIAKGARGREFRFEHLDGDEQAELKAGLAPRPKAASSSTTKRRAQDHPSFHQITQVAQHHAPAIAAGIVGGFKGVRAAITAAMKQSSNTPAANPKALASLAVNQAVTFNPATATAALRDLYDASSAVAGTRATAELLASAGITLNGISQSALTRISDAIAEGISAGSSHTQIADAVNAIIADPARADVIAITEANRSYNAAFIDTIQQAGGQSYDWVNDDDPCPACEAMIDDNPHPLSDDPPPLHPNCRCIAVEASASEAAAA